MPTINLTVENKEVTGDGAKIVCMNSDYVVRISASNCPTFTNAAVKKLIVRHNREYHEVNITASGGGYQATLPPIGNWDFVDLGICGKSTDSPSAVPVYSSKSARFACDNSILCGTVVRFSDPTLTKLQAVENGKYRAGDYASDGFYEVDVAVTSSATERRIVTLDMLEGDQIIQPSEDGLAMSQVTVTKPSTLVPANVVKGVNIGGVVGVYEKTFTEKSIFVDGEYTPDGFDGFSKVIVSVGKNSREKTMRKGHQFTYKYNASARVELSATGIVQYADTGESIVVTAIALGNCSVTVKDYNADNELVNVVYYDVAVNADGDATVPIEVDSATKMQEYLDRGVAGGVLKYVGDTGDVFIHNALYLVEEV